MTPAKMKSGHPLGLLPKGIQTVPEWPTSPHLTQLNRHLHPLAEVTGGPVSMTTQLDRLLLSWSRSHSNSKHLPAVQTPNLSQLLCPRLENVERAKGCPANLRG